MRRDDTPAAPADCLTLVMPLQALRGITTSDFYEYWLNAHVTLPARFPGISSIWLHVVSFDDATWPRLPGVSHRPPPQDEFQGVPELFGLAESASGSAAVQVTVVSPMGESPPEMKPSPEVAPLFTVQVGGMVSASLSSAVDQLLCASLE
jgi:hypothetical protein